MGQLGSLFQGARGMLGGIPGLGSSFGGGNIMSGGIGGGLGGNQGGGGMGGWGGALSAALPFVSKLFGKKGGLQQPGGASPQQPGAMNTPLDLSMDNSLVQEPGLSKDLAGRAEKLRPLNTPRSMSRF